MQTEITTQTGFAQLSDLPCLKLQFAEASAVVSLYGGQVLSYQPVPGQELLWVSSKAQWHNATAIRGGVPVCWPWFGPANSTINPEQRSLPNHGLVRNRLWQLQHSSATSEATSVTLFITIDDIPATLWPSATAEQQAVSLTLTLTLSASGIDIQLDCDTPLYQQAALHSYLRVGSITDSAVSGLSPHYFDKVSNTEQSTASGDTRFAAETDRIYFHTGGQLQLTDNKRQITIGQQGQDASIIWNPWQQKSRDLPDMADHGFTEFVCVESASLDVTTWRKLHLMQSLQLN
ncbi:hypothetical protein WG68_05050 [Arsukibacterium ikkense]|uniref:Putative glucose-6-phosphate 1-epimerase n=1 Tax=Arsukibacterium ikkense TaxID=336831 RepID=A0A0M2V8C0_9GAMM|nr:D-hexose-6-phosphate mutarotase [Arsukibacterium ikkense]KKO46654.1 hypothetical protein WG68_05050 [Arsukibacterium ikkense]